MKNQEAKKQQQKQENKPDLNSSQQDVAKEIFNSTISVCSACGMNIKLCNCLASQEYKG